MRNSLLARRGVCNLIRLVAAVAVLISHSYPISGEGLDPFLGRIPVGELAVSVFFVLSGVFIYSSSVQHSLKDFFFLRIARIFPALLLVNVVVAFVIGPILNITSSQTNYWLTSPNPLRYFAFNSSLVFGLQSGIGNLLSTVPFPSVINGSLWTLPTEIKSYFICAFLAVLSKMVKSNIPLYLCMIFFVAIYLCDLFDFILTQSIFETSSLKLFVIFFTGAMCTKLRVTVNLRPSLWFLSVLSLISIFLLIDRDSAPFLFWLVIPVLASTPIRIASYFNFLDRRDYSYGMYLWAFPVAQVVVYFDFADSAISLAILGGLITLLCALFSWHIVELPTLRAARRYISHQGEPTRTVE